MRAHGSDRWSKFGCVLGVFHALTACGGSGASESAATGGSSGSGGWTDSGWSGGAGGASDASGGQASGGTAGDTSGAGGSSTDPSGDTPCTFQVSHQLSEVIGTVGIVTFSADLVGMTAAQIEFKLSDGGGRTLTAPVNLDDPQHRTLLLGMKGDRQYDFVIVARAGDRQCTSETYTLKTGAVPADVPRVEVQRHQGQPSPGFYVTSTGMGNGYGGENAYAYVFDQDGDVVWWFEGPNACSRARMDTDGERMWMLEANYPSRPTSSGLSWATMDGLERQESLPGTAPAHHDFTVLPGGTVATMFWEGDCTSVVEVRPDGSLLTVVPDVSTLYTPGNECHGNALTYQEEFDTYILSDRSVSVFVRFDREGRLLWQLGGNDPLPGAVRLPGEWSINHGHQLLPSGNFLFFNNDGPNETSRVLEFALDLDAGTAEEVWSYEGEFHSNYMGDVQRLDNGNTVITYSQQSRFREVDPAGEPIVTYSSDGAGAGYALFRPTLYGPPPSK